MTDATLPRFEPLPEAADSPIASRRWLFFILNLASLIALGGIMLTLIRARGWSVP